MGENTKQIEQEIRDKRDNLGRNLDELEDKARELADWRTHYRNHSAAFVGAAFGVGVVLGLASIPRRHHHVDQAGSFEVDTSHDPYPARHAVARRTGPSTASKAVRQFGDTWEQIADALLRTASMKALEFVGELVPGFRDNVRRRDGLYDSGVTH